MNDETLRVVGIAGSLRKGSYNRALLAAARELAPADVEIRPFDIRPIPLYDADLDDEERRPEPVRRLKGTIAEADAVLLVSPEYNYGVPGVLKNTLDWASRPGFDSPFYRKPVGIMGASPGASGTMRGQEQLKLVVLGMAAQPFPHRGVAVARAGERFDDALRLVHEPTRVFLADYLEDFASWVRTVRAPGDAAAVTH